MKVCLGFNADKAQYAGLSLIGKNLSCAINACALGHEAASVVAALLSVEASALACRTSRSSLEWWSRP